MYAWTIELKKRALNETLFSFKERIAETRDLRRQNDINEKYSVQKIIISWLITFWRIKKRFSLE
jgi:hypothetical protein